MVIIGIVISIAATAAPPLAITRAESAPTTANRLQRYGAGPSGRDNGMKKPCTGIRTGPQVLCVRAGARGTGTAAAPMGTIGAAVAAARDGDIVQVAGGDAVRYSESVRVGNFGPGDCDNAGVAGRNYTFLGGFGADFTSRDAGANPTLVTGDGKTPAFVICVMGRRSIVDGFQISTRGRARGFVGSSGGYGNEGGSLVVSHNEVSSNRPPGEIDDSTVGGGISVVVHRAATVEVSDNYVHDNESGRGSGIATDTKSESKPIGTMKVLRNRVEKNTSLGSHGGGMNISGNAEIAYNLVLGNAVKGERGGGGWGGGFIAVGGRPVIVHHNVVTGNSGAAYGQGEFYDEDVDARVSFEFVAANGCSDDHRNSEILVDIGERGDSVGDFANITVVDHRCPTMDVGALVVQQGARAKVRKSIFANNIGVGAKPYDFGIDDTGTITVESTVTRQGRPGRGNVTADPAFIDVAKGDYRSKVFPDHGAFAPGGLDSRT